MSLCTDVKVLDIICAILFGDARHPLPLNSLDNSFICGIGYLKFYQLVVDWMKMSIAY